MTNKTAMTLALLLALTAAGTTLAADPAAPASAAGNQPGAMAGNAGAMPGGGPGMGRGGRGGGAARWGSDATTGWALMTPAERITHRDQMRTMTSRTACQAYVAEHHQQMVARAKERNQPLPTPRRDPCAGLAP
jgi:hypothetical protein